MARQEKTLTFKNYFVLILFRELCIAAILFSIFYVNSSRLINQFSHISVLQEPANISKIILVWTWPFHIKVSLNKCPPYTDISGCIYTANRTLYSFAGAVFLHHRDVCYSKKQLPQMPRPPNQYWVWFNLEPPSRSPNLHLMDNLINITMSYRADSDIFSPYGWLEPNQQGDNFTIPLKTKLVAWAISNWRQHSKRVRYYNKLKKYLPIEVYGRQHLSLPRNKLEETLSQYKFYLAFENSNHEDYITEKLWMNAMTFRCVPIVMGPSRQNYERFIPRDSFIHVDDFSSAEQLAKYILKLDKDEKAYQQYFTWRSKLHPFARTNWQTHYCHVCKALKEAPAHKTIIRLGAWYT